MVHADSAARVERDREPVPAVAAEVEPSAAHRLLLDGALGVSVDTSHDFLQARPPGAIWANRARLDHVIEQMKGRPMTVIFSSDGMAAHLAAIDLLEAYEGARDRVVVARGGLLAWSAVALPLDRSSTVALTTADRIDTLFWASQRRSGDPDAMRQYLQWEKNLLGQLAADGFSFRDEKASV